MIISIDGREKHAIKNNIYNMCIYINIYKSSFSLLKNLSHVSKEGTSCNTTGAMYNPRARASY